MDIWNFSNVMKEEVGVKGREGEGEGRGREGQVCSMRFPNTRDTPTPWANSMIKFCSSIHILLGHEL